jgi:hypothetical protein
MSFGAQRVFDRVLVVMFENQCRSYVLDNAFFRRLADQGIELGNYHGVMHPSQTNYIAAVAGELCGVTEDNPPQALLTQRTIVDLLEEAPTWLTDRQSNGPKPLGIPSPVVIASPRAVTIAMR